MGENGRLEFMLGAWWRSRVKVKLYINVSGDQRMASNLFL